VIVVIDVMRSCNAVGNYGPIVFIGRYGHLKRFIEMYVYDVITLKIANENTNIV
jgi:hypothetical protein